MYSFHCSLLPVWKLGRLWPNYYVIQNTELSEKLFLVGEILSLTNSADSLLCLPKSRENSPWRVTWRTFRLPSFWIWCQTAGPRGLTRPCPVWHCGSLTYWPELKSWSLGQPTLSYLRQCGWLASSTPSPSSQQSCKLWLEGEGFEAFGHALTERWRVRVVARYCNASCVWLTGTSGPWIACACSVTSPRRIVRTSAYRLEKGPTFMGCTWRGRAGMCR